MKTKLLLLSLFVAIISNVWAQGPNNSGTYYQGANGKKGSELKTALFNIIKSPNVVSYGGLYDAYVKTDTRPDGYVRDWYSNATNYRHNVDNKGSYSKEGDMYNREHSIPQSWFNEASPMKSDVVHVLPTDGYVNNRRSNYPLAEVNNVTYSSKNSYSKLGSCKTSGYSGTVFEPNDEIKGDMARIYFYMATCYQDKCNSWGHDVFSNENNGLKNWVVAMFMEWSKQDPVDAREIARNNAVQEVQGNRNPFVDYPGLEDYIWGTLKSKAFSYDHYEGGGSGETPTIAMPVFSPDAGTYYNRVMVELDCATEDADIYFTTDGADASEQSMAYMGPFEITQTSTIKAVAIKDGNRSAQAVATYTITDQQGGGGETPVDCDVVINNALFGSSATGTIAKSDDADLTGTQDGITFVYALGSGSQRFANATEIRLYKGNTLTISVAEGTLTALDFTIGAKTSALDADTGSFSEFKWTGNASQVVITSENNTALRNVKVSVSAPSGPSAIDNIQTNPLSGHRVIYNLRGQRVANPTHGIYIVDGKKVVIE